MVSLNQSSPLTISSDDNNKYLYLVLLISPLVALLLAILNYREKISRQIIFLTLVLYGLTMSYFGDGVGEAMKFARWSNYSFIDLLTYLKGLYQSGNSVDFVQQVIMYLLSRLTNNPSVYFGSIAAIFGFFYLKSLEHIYDQHNLEGNLNALVHFLFLCMVLSLPYISGSRWGLAAWIFFYAVYHFFLYRKRKFIFLALISIFVHFSFIGPVVIFLGLVVLGRRNILYYILIAASFIVQPLTSASLNQIGATSFIGVQERVSLYNNEDEMEFRQEIYQESAWYIKYPRNFIWIYLAIGTIFARRRFRSFSKDLLLEKLYSFCMLLFALANSFLKIPSGGRFQIIFFMFATVYLIILFSRAQPKSLSMLTVIGFIPMLLYFAVEIRRSFDSLNIALAAPLPISFLRDINLFHIQ